MSSKGCVAGDRKVAPALASASRGLRELTLETAPSSARVSDCRRERDLLTGLAAVNGLKDALRRLALETLAAFGAVST